MNGSPPGGGPPPQMPLTPPTEQSAPDQEKVKLRLIQQQLVLLIHAHKCMAKEQEDYTPNACTLPHCSTTREILRHMPTCNGNCPYVYCKSSRQILFHWKSCQKQDCTICRPLVTAYVGNQEARTSDQGDVGSPRSPSSGMGGSGNQLSPSLPVQQQMANATGGRGMGINSPNDGAAANLPNWSRPEQPLTNKDWHSDVTDDLRHNLVGKLVKAIFPSPNPVDLHDQRIQDLIEYARAVEMEMFENADDKEDYYRMLAERTLEIKMKQQEKIQKRLSESRENGSEMEASVKSEMPTSSNRLEKERLWTSLLPHLNVKKEEPDDFPCSVNRMGGGGWNPAIVKKEEPDDSPPCSANRLGGGGWNPALVKEEPGTCQSSSSTTAHPSTSTGVITPKRELNTPPPGTEYVHEQAELQRYLKPILSELCKTEDALPFKLPVDPYLLNIPDYFDIVKRPMDLSTMAKKLRKGQYTNPWQFCDDMWLMFDNAWLYNKKTSKVYKHSIKLSELFTERIKPVMVNMGYCCGNDLFFTPLALFCYGATMCMIGREQSYYCYETTSNAYGVVVSETYTYCVKCYEALPEEGISLSENPNDKSSMVPKSDFKMARNNVIEPEPFEHCKYCGRRWHKICALHDKKVFPEGFVCKTCRHERNMPPAENKFLAKKLATCMLSNHLEGRVNGYIKRTLKGGEHHEVVIRVLSVTEKEVEVKPMMKAKYCGDAPGSFPQKFPYKTKAIFAFQVIEGKEVCFFGMHVQEYGSKCPAPNSRRVYIAYLDSVHYFEPRQLRTDVYHEILLGYLQYAKKLGYTMAHIWACPPAEGDDYIFHCHPAEQKIPKPKRLQDWYKKMLDKGVQEKCVIEYKEFYKQVRDDGLTSPADLPYFEGDFWPNVIEDCIREASSEEDQRKTEENDENAENEDLFTAGGGKGDNGKKKMSKSKKNNLKKNAIKSKKKALTMTGNEITDKLYAQLEKHKEVFFTIRLVTKQAALSLTADIDDPDAQMSRELMDGRDNFLARAREDHWEFSSLRRSMYSTLCMAHALHVQGGKGMGYTCNQCDSTSARWHCSTCDDFDLCDNCKTTVPHEHPLAEIKTILDDGGSGGDGASSINRSYEKISACIESLVHACTCNDVHCMRRSCYKMKKIIAHIKVCKKRVTATCSVCRQLIAICCYHAKRCEKEGCQVPFCMNIRQKLMEQKRSLTRRSDMMMRRRMEGLSAAGPSSSSSGRSISSAGPSISNTNPPSTGGSSMVSSPGRPSPVSSMSSHNMKEGESGSARSSSNISQSHSSPIDHRSSKFGEEGMDASNGMAAYRGEHDYEGMGGQTNPMHSMGMRQWGHDATAMAAKQKKQPMKQQQQQQQWQSSQAAQQLHLGARGYGTSQSQLAPISRTHCTRQPLQQNASQMDQQGMTEPTHASSSKHGEDAAFR